MLLNVVNNYYKVVIKITGLRERTTSERVNCYEPRAITP